ncbi:hypothetical protein Lalb_Chr16g0388831 [Lupinus albus]|uniref:Uncharacterized protein n=1 Tax=Lupinus albus TaxID=3870 RepID=A0A6A4P722_LUPAL|nr:hypothetical protein Lalb_Chr16g0388831 [Lupinus albus]
MNFILYLVISTKYIPYLEINNNNYMFIMFYIFYVPTLHEYPKHTVFCILKK